MRVQPFELHKILKSAKVIKPVSHRSYEVMLELGSSLEKEPTTSQTEPGYIITPPQTRSLVHAPRKDVVKRVRSGQVRSGPEVIGPHYLKDCQESGRDSGKCVKCVRCYCYMKTNIQMYVVCVCRLFTMLCFSLFTLYNKSR